MELNCYLIEAYMDNFNYDYFNIEANNSYKALLIFNEQNQGYVVQNVFLNITEKGDF